MRPLVSTIRWARKKLFRDKRTSLFRRRLNEKKFDNVEPRNHFTLGWGGRHERHLLRRLRQCPQTPKQSGLHPVHRHCRNGCGVRHGEEGAQSRHPQAGKPPWTSNLNGPLISTKAPVACTAKQCYLILRQCKLVCLSLSVTSTLVQSLFARPIAFPYCGSLLMAPLRQAPALFANIRLGWKCWQFAMNHLKMLHIRWYSKMFHNTGPSIRHGF